MNVGLRMRHAVSFKEYLFRIFGTVSLQCILWGSIPIIFLLRITTTSNKCEMLDNLNLKVGGSSGRVVNRCC
jgi:hypothetical protein